MGKEEYVAAGTFYGSRIPKNPFELANSIPLQLTALYELLVRKAITRKLIIAEEGKVALSSRYITALILKSDEEAVGITLDLIGSNNYYIEGKDIFWKVNKYEGN